MAVRNRKTSTKRKTHSVKPFAVAVAQQRRHQTHEEERRMTAAFDLLVAELVRQQLGRGENM